MKIVTLWHEPDGDGCMPWMLSSYDEYTAEEHNGEPEFYTKVKKEYAGKTRELVIQIPDAAVTKLFKAPLVDGKVIP